MTDFSTSLHQLREELPNVSVGFAGRLVVRDDLRCGDCTVQPKVEQKSADGAGMPWRAGGIVADAAARDPAGRGPIRLWRHPADAVGHRGDPCDPGGGAGGDVLSVPADGAARGKYAARPLERWRPGSQCCRGGGGSRCRRAGAPGIPDRTAAAADEVAAFFGAAQRCRISHGPASSVAYSGPAEWRYRRFILHYAHLCAAAGGVDTFCIGSEMRGLTQVRGAGDSFPAVAAFRRLAADVRSILGPSVKIELCGGLDGILRLSAEDGEPLFSPRSALG